MTGRSLLRAFGARTWGLGYCVLLGVAVTALNPEWFLSRIGWVDTAIYFGQFRELLLMRSVFPGEPVGDLLPLLLPGSIAQGVFSPIVGAFVLKFFFFLLATGFFFATVKRTLGGRAALLATAGMGFYQYFVTFAGADYTTAPIMAYYAGALYAVTRATGAGGKAEGGWTFVAGMFFALTVFTTLSSLVYAPVLVLFHIMAKRARESRFHLLPFVTAILGFLCCTAVLAGVHFCYTGRFLFFSNSIGKAMKFLAATRGPQEIQEWLGQASWLALPAILILVGAIGGLVALGKGRAPARGQAAHMGFAGIFQILNALVLGIQCYLQFVKRQETLSNPAYACQMIPVAFLALAGLFSRRLGDLSPRAFAVLLGLFLVGSSGVIFLSRRENLVFPWTSNWSALYYFLPPVAGLLALYVPCRVSRSRAHARTPEGPAVRCVPPEGVTSLPAGGAAGGVLSARAAILVLISLASLVELNAFCVSPRYGNWLFKDLAQTRSVPSKRVAWLATAQWLSLMDSLDPRRDAFVWYSIGDRDLGLMFQQLQCASHLWIYRLVNQSFPSLDVPESSVAPPVAQYRDRPIFILGRKPDDLVKGQQAFAARHLSLSVRQTVPFEYASIKFKIWICSLAESP